MTCATMALVRAAYARHFHEREWRLLAYSPAIEAMARDLRMPERDVWVLVKAWKTGS